MGPLAPWCLPPLICVSLRPPALEVRGRILGPPSACALIGPEKLSCPGGEPRFLWGPGQAVSQGNRGGAGERGGPRWPWSEPGLRLGRPKEGGGISGLVTARDRWPGWTGRGPGIRAPGPAASALLCPATFPLLCLDVPGVKLDRAATFPLPCLDVPGVKLDRALRLTPAFRLDLSQRRRSQPLSGSPDAWPTRPKMPRLRASSPGSDGSGPGQVRWVLPAGVKSQIKSKKKSLYFRKEKGRDLVLHF
ncbi:uncharacterized protein LOC104854474 [Fukomys damarensis]|uniref:uncharacterized protein LOC104854474 n=1 Tax=Fukomys damarensis TaxID=885580 RepID=UPI00053FF9B1|nr:uncharacterized protein LOC104854474 [Fukomys damarensis]